MIKVILKEPIPNLGRVGDLVEASGGFVRNYLLPQKKAVLATKDNMAEFELQRAELEKLAAQRLAEAMERQAALAQITVTIAAHAGEGGKLFGSVGTKEIAHALAEAGVKVHKSEVRMPTGQIRATGDYEIEIGLHPDVTATIVCKVIAAEMH